MTYNNKPIIGIGELQALESDVLKVLDKVPLIDTGVLDFPIAIFAHFLDKIPDMVNYREDDYLSKIYMQIQQLKHIISVLEAELPEGFTPDAYEDWFFDHTIKSNTQRRYHD